MTGPIPRLKISGIQCLVVLCGARPRSSLYVCSEVEAHLRGRLPFCLVSIELDLTREITRVFT